MVTVRTATDNFSAINHKTGDAIDVAKGEPVTVDPSQPDFVFVRRAHGRFSRLIRVEPRVKPAPLSEPNTHPRA